ncbi:hypothetical protein M438DRAFT_408071 [Aureobasidium pullulans EXF-150]|uniref:RNI-like protein n=1 Tax=Aureobasidium pullulans EXF-150 TaxID=1043002 RepID=A0A074X7D7_AURPU|nr:uncharacterized protein M438DRAFT_408071 [Aureobasidium pullulans EXF-150]KEQ81298.1 hypothetical protein M438DRAFT_408071 [Aureobasidium pullulans EXF-150]
MTAASQVFDLPELVRDILDQVYEQESSNRLHSNDRLKLQPLAYSLEDDRGPHGPQVPPNLAGLQLSGPPGMQNFPPFTPVALQLPQESQLAPGMPNLLPLPDSMGPLRVAGPGMHPDMPGLPTPNSGWQTPPQSFKIDNQLDGQLLDKILNSCPRVQHLGLSHKFACGYSSQFSQHLLHLLRSLKHLRSLRMDCKCLTEDAIVFLITHQGLQVLKGLRCGADRITTAMRRISPAQSFPALRVLDMHLDQTSIPLLLENVTTLQELRLTDVSPNAFATIGKLKGLTKLTLTVDKQESRILTDHHFYELQSLCILRKLSVTSVEFSYVHGIQDFNQTIAALATGLPRLQELGLILCNVFDGDVLRTIGTECPLLHDLRIQDCRLNQADLEEGHHPLFRRLKTFDMRTLYLSGQHGDLIWGVRSVGDPINQSTTMFHHIPEYFQSLNETEDHLYESRIIEHPLVTQVLAQSIVENFPNLIRFDVSASSNGAILTRMFEEIKGIAGPKPLDVPRWNIAFGDGDDDYSIRN